MKSVRLVASDMDHTLLDGQGEFPPGFVEDLRQLGDAGIVFVAASGRPLYTLRTMFPESDHIAFISDNGGTVTYRGEVLFQSLLPTVSYQEMIELTLARTTGVPMVCGIESAYVWSGHREHEDHLRRFQTVITFVDDLTAVDAPADKFTAYFADGASRHFHETVFEPAYGAGFSVTVGGPAWMDIMNPGVNKGTALRVLADRLGLERDQLMAFGDTDNDLEMLGTVYHSYAVGNADDAIHEIARFATASNEQHGVAQVIRQLLASHRSLE
ncbi:MAG: HAD family phosphatase [Propionibacteriaceae bacterium]|nr:HAD family phosphatase [Propionibacteriaceae bacterium]